MHLFSFVGNSDLAAAGLGRGAPGDGPGPVARATDSGLAAWSTLTLVSDRPNASLIEHFAEWLSARSPNLPLQVWRHPVQNPAAFEQVLDAAHCAVVKAVVEATERAYLATPGTAAMGMAWLYLALQPATRGRVLTAHTGQPCAWVALPRPEPCGRCVILRGVPGAGKSTLARELAACQGLDAAQCVFSTDDRFDELNGGVFDPALLSRMHQLNLTRFIEAMQRGVPLVVCDNTNIEPWEYAPYVAAAQALGYSVEVRLVGDPGDETELAACAKRNPRGLSAERIEIMAAKLQAQTSRPD